MSCAGCDDCPSDAWHLHITVASAVPALEGVAEALGYKLLTIENLLWLGGSSTEYVPTAHFTGSYADALVKLFRDSCAFAAYGLVVLRAKIEGPPSRVETALYYEAHVKMHNNDPHSWGTVVTKLLPPVSRANGRSIITLRRDSLTEVERMLGELYAPDTKVEACAFDTNPDLDAAWIKRGQ